jgi:hypothetical protein
MSMVAHSPPTPFMKTRILATVVAVVAVTILRAQEPEPISPDDLAKAVPMLMEESARLGNLPLKLDLDPDKAAGFKVGDVGGIFIPDKRFKSEKGDRADRRKKGVPLPVGQLWTSKLSLLDKDTVLANDRLRLVRVTTGDKTMELAVFALGIEKAGKKGFELALYGKDNVPVLRVPLTAAKSKGAAPVIMSARKTGDESGVLEFNLLGRFKAEIPVGKQAE